MIQDIEIIQNCDPILNKKIVLYGGGYYGEKAATMLQRLGVPIEAICCTTMEEENPLIKGVPYIGPSDLKKLDDKEELLIVIATTISEFVEQIIETLDQYQIFRGQRITYLALCYACKLNRKMDKGGILALEYELWRIAYENHVRSAAYQALWRGFSQNAVWVYSSGKVGSSTLRNSLEKCGIPNVQIHTMQKEGLRYGTFFYLDGRKTLPDRPFEEYEVFLEHLKKQQNIRIITAVRDPIARDISAFFQSFLLPYSRWIDQTNDLYNDFIRMTKNITGNGHLFNMFHWFDEELKSVFGVDIYGYPFDREQGYTIIKEGNISVLVLKLEKINDLVPVIGRFIQAEDFKLVNANEKKGKPYRYMYEEFKQNVKLPQSYLDSYYRNNPYMDHFYSKEEQAMFLQRWSRNIVKD